MGSAGLWILDVTYTPKGEDQGAPGREVSSLSPDANESLSGNTPAITIFIEMINLSEVLLKDDYFNSSA